MSTIRGNVPEPDDHPIPRLDLYKIALDEYRFEVKLNADRTIQYLTLSALVLSAGVGLLRIGSTGASTNFFVGLIFFSGIFIAVLGIQAIRRGREYYRNTIYKKTVIEDLLGLNNPVPNHPRATLAVTTTRGQKEVPEMLRDPDAWMRKTRPPGAITGMAVFVLGLFAAIDVAGIVVLILQYLHSISTHT
jgi:hypothetical protein